MKQKRHPEISEKLYKLPKKTEKTNKNKQQANINEIELKRKELHYS